MLSAILAALHVWYKPQNTKKIMLSSTCLVYASLKFLSPENTSKGVKSNQLKVLSTTCSKRIKSHQLKALSVTCPNGSQLKVLSTTCSKRIKSYQLKELLVTCSNESHATSVKGASNNEDSLKLQLIQNTTPKGLPIKTLFATSIKYAYEDMIGLVQPEATSVYK